jgi:anthranilate phosphoribosyltransferase
VTSTCGSADALEALGLPLTTEPEAVAGELAARHFAFLFAPGYHPAFKHIMPVRREIGCRTLFNLLGPLLNPARPTHQLLGVGIPGFAPRMAKALALTGVSRACVVHGAGGFDELTPFGVKLRGLGPRRLAARRGTGPAGPGPCAPQPRRRDRDRKEAAVAVLRELLEGGGPQAMRDMLVLNVAVCLFLLDAAPGAPGTMAEAVEQARAAVAAGAGRALLHA